MRNFKNENLDYNSNLTFKKILNHLKIKAPSADKIQLTLFLLYICVGFHIFLLPDDILDKFEFLTPYTEFMKKHIIFINHISAQINSIPQIATIYASNMVVLSLLIFFPLFIYNALLINIKRFEMFGLYEYNPYYSSVSHNKLIYFGVFLIFVLAFNYLYFHAGNIFNETKLLNIGNIFLSQSSEYSKIKFGLLYKMTALLGGAIFFYSLAIVYLLNQIITIMQKFNLIKNLSTKDKK